MRESQIEKYLCDGVKAKNGEIRKLKWQGRRGAPDRMVWIPGWKFPKMPELKRPGKNLEDHQRREHARLEKMGIRCMKLNTLAEVDWFLNA